MPYAAEWVFHHLKNRIRNRDREVEIAIYTSCTYYLRKAVLIDAKCGQIFRNFRMISLIFSSYGGRWGGVSTFIIDSKSF